MHLVTRHPFKKPNLVQRPQSIGCAAEHVPHSRWAVWRWRRNRVGLKKCGFCQSSLGLQVLLMFSKCFPNPRCLQTFFCPSHFMDDFDFPFATKSNISCFFGLKSSLFAILTLGQSFVDIFSHIQIPQKHNMFFCWGRPRIRLPNPTWAETHL